MRPPLILGNYVYRGAHSLETMCLLLALHIEHPGFVHLIRGMRCIDLACTFLPNWRKLHRHCRIAELHFGKMTPAPCFPFGIVRLHLPCLRHHPQARQVQLYHPR